MAATTAGGTQAAYLQPHRREFVKKWAAPLIAMGEFIDGYDLVVIGVAMVFLKPHFGLSASATGGLLAISFIGTAVGLIFFGDIADRIGRKKVFAVNLWIFIITAVLAAFITQVWMIYVMRFLIGLAVGMDLSTSAAYLAEIAPKQRRGRVVGALLNTSLVLGSIFSIVLALVLQEVVPASHQDWIWRGLFLFAAVPAALVLYGRQFLPESPRWLMQVGRVKEAEQILQVLGLDREYAEVRSASEQEGVKTKREYKKLLQPETRKRIIATTLFFMGNTFGGPVVSLLGPIIFQRAGIEVKYNLEITLAAYIVALVALLLGSTLIDKINKRVLGMSSTFVLACAAFSLAMWGDDNHTVLFVSFVVWTFATWIGPGLLCLIWTVESYPTELRGFGNGFTQSLARVISATSAALVPVWLAQHSMRALFPFVITYLLMFVLVLFNPWMGNSNASLEEASGQVPGGQDK
ncbi:MFS transporter [Corynebacterium mendelii]|uniref:MFS transporter n=1 Tax=Corynebacterium mendelii TaxID=2765362 RepID=A0A939E0X9_9CORY|nr:MFS transporter [Corynebacterium mendelii]MBN9644935.1 MFS transporter [Corynebacterium mendelii]